MRLEYAGNTQGLSSLVRFVLSAIPVDSFALSAIYSGEIHWHVSNLRQLFMLRSLEGKITGGRISMRLLPGCRSDIYDPVCPELFPF